MPMNLFRPRVAAIGIVMCILAAGVLRAGQEKSSDPSTLPDGKAVLDRAMEATGGREAYEKIKSRITHATMEMPAMGMTGKVTTWQVAPDRGLIEVEIPGAGEILQGFDGTVVWMNSTVTGPRIVEGAERDTMVRSLSLSSELHPEKHYQSIKNMGIVEVDGKSAYKLELATAGGRKETRYYDKDSGLMLKMETTTPTQMGDMHVVATVSDWQDFNGFKAPRKTLQKMPQGELTLTIEKMEHNAVIPAEKLEMPEEVKALLTKKPSSPATQPKD